MEIASLLKQYQLRPRKSLGQNFLTDEHALAQIVANAGVTRDDIVLEIGPGLGSLTRHLAEAARHVIAVEIDQALLLPLRSVVAEYPNVSIVHGDILQIDPAKLVMGQLESGQPVTGQLVIGQLVTGQSVTGQLVIGQLVTGQSVTGQLVNESVNPPINQLPINQLPINQSIFLRYKVVANIPYYITSAIIRHLLEAAIQPGTIVLTVQQEVARRIIAQPDDMNLLAISVQFYGAPRIVQRIKAEAFYPAPDVDSAVVRIDLPDEPRYAVDDVDLFFRVAKAGFGQKRKQLHNALRAGLSLPGEQIDAMLTSAGIDPKRRAETLSLSEWVKLVERLKVESGTGLHPSAFSLHP